MISKVSNSCCDKMAWVTAMLLFFRDFKNCFFSNKQSHQTLNQTNFEVWKKNQQPSRESAVYLLIVKCRLKTLKAERIKADQCKKQMRVLTKLPLGLKALSLLLITHKILRYFQVIHGYYYATCVDNMHYKLMFGMQVLTKMSIQQWHTWLSWSSYWY